MEKERRHIEWGWYAVMIPGAALLAVLGFLSGTDTGGGLAIVLAAVVGFNILDLAGDLLARLTGWE